MAKAIAVSGVLSAQGGSIVGEVWMLAELRKEVAIAPGLGRRVCVRVFQWR
jgi:hypothetical protein